MLRHIISGAAVGRKAGAGGICWKVKGVRWGAQREGSSGQQREGGRSNGSMVWPHRVEWRGGGGRWQVANVWRSSRGDVEYQYRSEVGAASAVVGGAVGMRGLPFPASSRGKGGGTGAQAAGWKWEREAGASSQKGTPKIKAEVGGWVEVAGGYCQGA